mmetsp:Transcript_6346/g.15806  ORF Transcript_6346/g.15806 Transcript_6346/m.15806 type:complete len:849 (-) Transcript_6346:127-2673(-)|eukprot:CAMPEP_0181366804 /NCGR_PEP_ID=MMETSP1106-20121128/10940_1 /TAXON_ID=81844 /ORGANISM="Mantoniella antarctica, Strain SL-175" /LENGTH=848 /DNA_ID=CAMNT_0023482259 /DNA_START=94 /DNA_END=2640 /DNA_ORIENTATION=-
MKETHPLHSAIMSVARLAVLAVATYFAYDIRLYAIREYGRVIHEFDPWFNFRATQYLADNGWHKFSHWFDYMSWYPLGRPVGTTIYPGMQVTAVSIWKTLNAMGKDYAMSLNDVCVFFPAWFGAVATCLVAFLTAECSGSSNSAVIAAMVMSVIPAHIMRSVGGGYDNESLAVTAMCLTFFVWCRALRNRSSWWIGALAGLAYVYMVAAWGGYTFVLNMVGLHAAMLVILGQYNASLHKAYSLFWIVGTLGAIQFPVVGLAPIKSMEQLGPMAVFLGMQVLECGERIVKHRKLTGAAAWRLRINVYAAGVAALAAVILLLAPTGYFGPLSVRVRGLFVKHTKTGNPLVDSVAEHQPGTPDAYWRYLHYPFYVAPVGFVISLVHYLNTRSPAALFLPLYAVVAYYFANRMVRLIIFMGPIASSLTGIGIGYLVDDILGNASVLIAAEMKKLLGNKVDADADAAEDDNETEKRKGREMAAVAAKEAAETTPGKGKGGRSGKGKVGKVGASVLSSKASYDATSTVGRKLHEKLVVPFIKVYDAPGSRVTRIILAVGLLAWGSQHVAPFWKYSHDMAQGMSQPSIMFKGQLQDGSTIMVKDYLEAYWWLRDNTPEDARVMAWWDYGYQVTGIANRTSIADGNTWNHEHIANLARSLTATEEKGHRVIRHLADYVLVWSGGGADDMAKSPHLFRIGKSIGYSTGTVDMYDIQSKFGVDQYGRPTPLMAQSLLYKLVSFQGKVSEARFKEVYTSKYRKVRIYKVVNVSETSKKWLADPANRLCDAPGSWYCPGQYPPGIAKFTGIIKPAYNMPAFVKMQSEEKAKAEARAGSVGGEEAPEKKRKKAKKALAEEL